MILYFLTIVALFTCLIISLLLKFTSIRHISRQQEQVNLQPNALLKLIKKRKPFPIGSQKGWKIYNSCCSNRIWTRTLTSESSQLTVQLFASFSKVPASSQVIFQTLRDTSKVPDWKSGVDAVLQQSKDVTLTSGKHSSWMESTVRQDVVLESVFDKSSTHVIQTVQREINRIWNREDNGCCWLLESESSGTENIFYLIQPLEDLDSSLLSVVGYLPYPASITDNIDRVSSIITSAMDYFVHRKLKVTPVTDIKLPVKHLHHTLKGKQRTSSTSSEEEWETDEFSQKFSHLDPEQKSAILQRSESILRLSHARQLVRSQTVSENTAHGDNSGSDKNRTRSSTCPVTRSVSAPINSQIKDNLPSNNTSSEKSSSQLSNGSVENAVEKSGCDSSAVEKEMDKGSRQIVDVSVTDSENSSQDYREELSDCTHPTQPVQSSKDAVKYTTLANQIAAELLALVLKVSNLDLRSSSQQQQEVTGGWMFCGLDSDVVIIKRQYHHTNLSGSYMGKGLIQAPPQTVMDTLKNPRTRFTYDESLKKVEILEHVSDKVKRVYYYHEMVHMFKKIGYDFCVIQSERSEGDKLVLSMESIDCGLPTPVGVDRVQMMTSGWIIEPVTKDNKLCSMVTYIMQMNFGQCSENTADKQIIEEIVSKHPLSIAYLRQYLRPAFIKSHTHSKK